MNFSYLLFFPIVWIYAALHEISQKVCAEQQMVLTTLAIDCMQR